MNNYLYMKNMLFEQQCVMYMSELLCISAAENEYFLGLLLGKIST